MITRPLVPFLLSLFLTLVACAQTAPGPPARRATTPGVKILIAEDGFYKIPLPALQEANLALGSLAVDNLELSQGGEPVPYLLVEDELIFYGQAPSSRYTAVRPYVLWTGRPGIVMKAQEMSDNNARTAGSAPQRLLLEENRVYVSQARSDDGNEPWYWETIQVGATVPIVFDLPDVGDGSGRLRIRLWGTSYAPQIDPDHDVDLFVNEKMVETIIWDGEQEHIAVIDLPPDTLRAGQNELIFDNSGPGAAFIDISQLDWIELVYDAPTTAVADRYAIQNVTGRLAVTGFATRPRLFDITDPAAPAVLTGWPFEQKTAHWDLSASQSVVAVGPAGYRQPQAIKPLRLSDWRTESNQADLLIVTTDAFISALTPLVEARQEQGLQVAVVPVEEIYDAFGHGEESPESIRSFVTYAYENWAPPRPTYLFLVGDATRDYRSYVDRPPQNHVPSLMVEVNYSGETVSDARLADVNGDLRPDLAVGRWPVDDAAAVSQLVVRTLAYEKGPAIRQTLFAVDGTSSEFSNLTDRLVSQSALPADKATILDGPPASEVIRAWNDGAWLVTYTGHGSLNMWGKDELLTAASLGKLTANGSPPIVLQLTCLTGLFAHPTQPSLSELMLLEKNGPVLLIAATSLTVSAHQEPFALEFLLALQDPDVMRIGDALQLAKGGLDVAGSRGLREVSDTFGLLGDPSTLIVRPD